MIEAIILAAGYGTRAADYSQDLPKGLLTVADKPALLYPYSQLVDSEHVHRIKIITNRSFHSCYADFVNRYPSSKVDLITETTSTQAEPLGAVATLEKALKFCNQESNILLLAADNVFDFSLDAMMEFFNQTQGNVFGLYEVSLEDAIHHSVVDLENGKVIRYEEKPDVAFSNKIVTYCMILTRRTLNGIPEYLHRGGDRDGIGKFLVSTLPDIDLIAYPFEGKWFDIGSKSSFDAANRYFGK